MKPKSSIAAGFILLLIPYFAHSADFVIQPPPASMDKFYVERGKTSDWIVQMSHISKTFAATSLSIERKNWGEALKQAKDFSLAYQKASRMVPEWKDLFDLETSELLISSIQNQDIEKFKTFSTKLRKTCTQCHGKHYISVWTRYHWPSTQTIKVLDPLSEQELDYDRYMHKLSSSLKNVEIFFKREEYNESWKAIDDFSKRLRGLRSVCSKCHVSEWTKNPVTVKEFFVGEDMIDALQEIKKTFATGTPDKKLFKKKMDYISEKSCKTCHMIHQPATIIQKAWKENS